MAKTSASTNSHPINKLHKAWKAGETPMSQMTKEEIKAAEDKIRGAHILMLGNNSFFAFLSFKLKRIISDGSDVPGMGHIKSACTDGRNIYYNPAFINALTVRETIFVVIHELYHCVFKHMLLRGNRDPKLWNAACDYVINGLCVKEKCGDLIEGCYHDKKFYDMDSFKVYDLLKEEMEKNGGQSASMDAGSTLDDHFDGSPGGENEGNKKMDGSPSEAKAISDEIQSAIIQAVAACTQPGHIPGDIRRMVDHLLNPKIDWRDMIETTVASKIKYDISFARPDRKSWSNSYGVIFPGDLPDTEINVAIAVDNSGSFTNQMLTEALSEIAGIMENFNSYKIQLWCFDTRVSGYRTFDNETMEDIRTYEFTGGGGTAIAVNWDYMTEKEIEADLFICFTDLYSGDLNRIPEDQIDTLWIIHDNPNGVPPFGRYAYYEPGKRK